MVRGRPLEMRDGMSFYLCTRRAIRDLVRALTLVLVFSLPATAQVATGRGADLRALDKIDGHVADIEIRAGETVSFGRLEVTLGECRYPVNNPTGNAYAWLVIDQGAERLFEGWMIASSPALNALDHPRFDVWVTDCAI